MRVREGWIPVPEACYRPDGTLDAGAADPDAFFREAGINPFAALGLTLDSAGLTRAGSKPGPPPAGREGARTASAAPATTPVSAGSAVAAGRRRQSLLPVVGLRSGKRPAFRCGDCGGQLADGDEGLARAAHAAVCPRRPQQPAERAGAALEALPSVCSRGGVRVVAVRLSACPPRALARAAALLASMGEAMNGRVGPSDESLLRGAGAEAGEPGLEARLSRAGVRRDEAAMTVLACIGDGGRVVGVASAEPISGARRAGARTSSAAGADVVPARVGVRQIWTHTGARRRGVGRLLLESAALATLARPVGMDDLAVSAPTEAGAALAASVMGRADFAVYG